MTTTNKLPKVCGPLLLIKPIEFENKTKSGLVLPDQFKEDMQFLTNVGKVLSMGPIAFEEIRQGENRFGREKWCTIGDYVVWPKHAGKKVMYNGEPYVLINDDQIMLVIDDPESIKVEANAIKY